MPTESSTVSILFAGGEDNLAPETRISQNPESGGYLRSAVNVDLDAARGVRRRLGYTLVRSGRYTSLWGHPENTYALAVKAGSLIRIDPDLSETTLRTDFGDASLAAVLYSDGAVYYSNGGATGRLTDTTHTAWGLPLPPLPQVSATTGGLPVGGYQVAYTYRLASGEESGASPAAYLYLSNGGGLTLANLPNVAGIATLRVYLSPADGDMLYAAVDVAMGASNVTLTALGTGKRLETQFMQPPPAPSALTEWRGRLWLAVGSYLFFTQPGNPLLVDLRTDFFSFSTPITDVISVLDGLYVLADRAYFLSGDTPASCTLRVVDAAPAIVGTGLEVKSAWVPIPWQYPTDHAAFWWSTDGDPVYGLPGGQLVKPVKTHYRAPSYPAGKSVAMIRDGITQLLTLMQGDYTSNNAVAGDSVTAEVHSHGLT